MLMDILLQVDYKQWQDTPKHYTAFIIFDHTFDIIAKVDPTMSKWCRLASYLAQFQLMIIIYHMVSTRFVLVITVWSYQCLPNFLMHSDLFSDHYLAMVQFTKPPPLLCKLSFKLKNIWISYPSEENTPFSM